MVVQEHYENDNDLNQTLPIKLRTREEGRRRKKLIKVKILYE